MIEETVHLKHGKNRHSNCGLNLFGGSSDPALFIQGYKPDRERYSVCKVVNVDIAYPVFEQVQVVEEVIVCEDCLSFFGMHLLNTINNFLYSRDH